MPIRASEDLRLGAYLKVFGNELSFLSLSKENIVELIRKGMLSVWHLMI